MWRRADPHRIVHDGQTLPPVLATLGPEHGVRRQYVDVRRRMLEEEMARVLLDGEDVDDQQVLSALR